MSNITNPETYVTPEPVFAEVQMRVSARSIRKGDVLQENSRHRAPAPVADVTVGRKWVTLRDADGKLIAELAIDGPEVGVARPEQTPASLKARMDVIQSRALAEKIVAIQE